MVMETIHLGVRYVGVVVIVHACAPTHNYTADLHNENSTPAWDMSCTYMCVRSQSDL